MDCQRGQIFNDPGFKYDPDSEKTCDKYLLILNKDHAQYEDVVWAPATTNRKEFPYKPGCNEDLRTFYFEKDGSFYAAGSVIQFDHIQIKDGEEFEKLVERKGILLSKKTISKEELGQILNCFKRVKEYYPKEILDLIF